MRKSFRKSIIKLSLSVFSVLAFSVFAQTQAVLAHEGSHQEDGTHSYTAVAGDSLTGFARSAVATQTTGDNISLSPAQRVYAETIITSKLGGELLEIGQKVTIPRNILNSAIESAQKLTKDQQANWQPYAALVNYDAIDHNLSNGAEDEATTRSDDKASKDNDKEKTDDQKQGDAENSPREEKDSPWYANVFTWVLIIAAAIIGWSLWASRKSEE